MTKATALSLHSSNGVNMLPHACQQLCNLRLLYISDSSVDSLRYLGAHFPKLKELTLADCNIRDLDGITSFPNLKILRLPGNEIQSVDQCIHLFQLCHLDVQRNLIDDIASLQWLNLCPKLVSLVLYSNPLYLSIKEGQPKCTEADVIKVLPKLKYLDGRPLYAIAQKLKKFRKWWTPYLTKKEDFNVRGQHSRVSFETESYDSTSKISILAEKSASNETFEL
ncbi:hypothetical protein CDAR_16211 [Caerostris darwini]|uniref:Uncharacterized protein n=1 Tax=Caerostris darwini TaxID=1538125 RepID=A0AAV4QRH9_9ARAC|nr:hypothetical protein CDAR_16211 [Caerostris darwini]